MSDYLKSLSQEAKNLMDEIEETNDHIVDGKVPFIGSNKKKFNFNIKKPLDFIGAIYNSKISLKEAEIKQGDLENKIEELKDYRLKNPEEEEKKEINEVLMQANDMLEYRNKIIKAFKNGTFLSKHLKKSDAAAYDYVLKEVTKSIKKIESMAENINLSLFLELFELLPVDYSKCLINLKNRKENKELVTEAKNRISDLKDTIRNMSKKEKKIVQMRH